MIYMYVYFIDFDIFFIFNLLILRDIKMVGRIVGL